MENKLVSIIIPIYNAEEWISQCITSIITQSYSKLQIILVDDGSTDQSGEICESFARKDNRVTVIHKSNGGVSSARNTGLLQATGEFIFFIDSDDWVDPDYISDFMQYDDCQYVVCGYIEDSKTKWYLKYAEQTISINDIQNHIPDITSVPLVHCCGVRYTAEIIKSNHLRFNEEVHCSEDNLFNIEYLYYVHNIKVLDSIKYHYRIHSSSAIHRFHLQRAYFEKCVCKAMEKIITADSDEFKSFLYVHWIIGLEHYYAFRKNKEARSALKLALCDSYFRQAIPYCKKYGTIDMKVFALCAKINNYNLYKFIIKSIKNLSAVKSRLLKSNK